ncbi:Uncharacterised protein [Segatella copri]|nr:Uncharacterised protein [Segatella copri]
MQMRKNCDSNSGLIPFPVDSFCKHDSENAVHILLLFPYPLLLHWLQQFRRHML